MSAKNITSEKMNFNIGGYSAPVSEGGGKKLCVLTKQPNKVSAKGPGAFGGKESKNTKAYKG